jgi:DNA-binding IclR family transcriptional regulator
MSVLDVAAPALAALNARFGEAVTFYERVDHEVIALTRLECRHRVRLTYTRGQLLPWPATASSKVLLAHAGPDEQEALLRLMEPVRYTKKTVPSVKALRQALERIRGQGYAYSDEERDEGVRGIAAPVLAGGRARYCVSLSGPAFRLTDGKVAEMSAAVKNAAMTISEALRKTEY